MIFNLSKDNKNTILLLILIPLICLVIVYGLYIFKNITETFQNKNNCNYFPWGPTHEACVKNCTSNERIGLWDVDGKQCNKDICEYLCTTCTDNTSCQWINTWSEKEQKKLLETIKPPSALSSLVPRQLRINAVTTLFLPDAHNTVSVFNQNKGLANIKVSWKNHDDSKQFMIHYYNLNSQSNLIKVLTINDKSIEEKHIRNIEKDSEYYIIMYAINEYGVSLPSNIEIVKT